MPVRTVGRTTESNAGWLDTGAPHMF